MSLTKQEEKLHIIRHSAAHLLAHAVTDLFPNTKLTIGPSTTDGFFYDFLPETNFKEEDLPLIEKRMQEIVEANYPIEQKEISKQEARKLYHDNPFKLELIDGIEGDTVGLATQGPFYDLCRGGHVASTGLLKNFKLLHISGSYWRADRNNQPLQRISGTAFETAQELEQFLLLKEEAAKYDHRKLGKELNLFSFHDEAPGMPFFLDKGKTVIEIMIQYLRSLLKGDYQEISSPLILNASLWKQSGHYQNYKDFMYFCDIDGQEFAVRPMNCPGSILVYQERPHSFRELPIRIAEFGIDHRHELSGVLHGLFRVRAFTMDDAHVFCTPEQIESEVIKLIKLVYTVLNKFGFDNISVAISTRPEKSMGKQEEWDVATSELIKALDKCDIAYKIQEGEGAFYGPKIEIKIKDSMGREWQCSTIQVDFVQPENFDVNYIASGGQKKRVVMIHRAIYGSIERFFGIILEHYKGRLPFWLAPVQAKILTITDEQMDYAKSVAKTLQESGLRVEIDPSSEQISYKIKAAQIEKTPWMIVLGKKEQEAQTVTLRHADGTQKFGLNLQNVIELAKEKNLKNS